MSEQAASAAAFVNLVRRASQKFGPQAWWNRRYLEALLTEDAP